MIKNFESFVNGKEEVNEGFLHNVLSGIEAGIGAFKADRSAEKEADEEMKLALNTVGGESNEYSDKTKMTILVKQLVERSVLLADGFSWEKVIKNPTDAELLRHRIETLGEILAKMEELLKGAENLREE